MPESELELKSMLADARLKVAEHMGWSCAILAFIALDLWKDSWIISLLGGGVTYYFSTFEFSREAKKAEDAYHREAKRGKYYKPEEDET
ncbi:hypothetical protein [Herbaspirillum huttiense]|uniref:hypothetical protein n=1 Tax=Herbaspirillum huttiense TaxID=863372 RepID=UPI002E774AEF|nr:hypothetical protein [Herbaspirillum huttiense]MEE1636481.1 hypothetical protein [Herbaspirillum huttiense NC40101]